MKIILEWDDLNPNPNVDCLPIIDKLVGQFPKIVLNFFTVPIYGHTQLSYSIKWCDRIRTHIDNGNVVLGVHGTYHSFREYALYDYPHSAINLKHSHDKFNEAKLPFVKCFRGPYWGICEGSVEALIDMGYTHLYSHKEYTTLNEKYADRIKIVYYNWNMKDEWPKLENPLESDIVVAHGHTAQWPHLSCGNGIWECYDRLCSFIDSQDNIEFLRIDQYE